MVYQTLICKQLSCQVMEIDGGTVKHAFFCRGGGVNSTRARAKLWDSFPRCESIYHFEPLGVK